MRFYRAVILVGAVLPLLWSCEQLNEFEAGPDAGSASGDGGVGVCSPEPDTYPPRPKWSEIEPNWAKSPEDKNTHHVPDYSNVARHLKFLDGIETAEAIRVVASLMSKAVVTLESVTAERSEQDTGYCLCACEFPSSVDDVWPPQSYANLGEMLADLPKTLQNAGLPDSKIKAYERCYKTERITRGACREHCDAQLASRGSLFASPPPDDPVLSWVPHDIFRNPDGTARYALELIGMLDDARGFLEDDLKPKLEKLETFKNGDFQYADKLMAALDHLDTVPKVINWFTEGYHLGNYSPQRPNLHQCVAYYGSGTMAELVSADWDFFEKDIVSFEMRSRYGAEQLSASHRAQMRTGGFEVSLNDKTLNNPLPGMAGTLQIQGFRMWDKCKPFGIPLANCNQKPITKSEFDQYDVFQLVDDETFSALAGADGRIEMGDIFYETFYPTAFTTGGETYSWPRNRFNPDAPNAPTVDPWDGWAGEDSSTSVLSAGINLPLDFKQIDEDLPPIPIWPPTHSLELSFSFDLDLHWDHEVNHLRKKIRDTLEGLEPLGLAPVVDEWNDHIGRDDRAMQAPDVTEDIGQGARMKTSVTGILNTGFPVSGILSVDLGVGREVGVEIAPEAWGGVADLDYTIIETLQKSTPPPDAACEPVYETRRTTTCSNADHPQSTREEFACAPADTESSCCFSVAGTSSCVADWTGIDRDFCERLDEARSDTEIAAWVNRLMDYTGSEVGRKLLESLEQAGGGQVGATATWNPGKTCAEASCALDIRPSSQFEHSACQRHGICKVVGENGAQVVARDVTESECLAGTTENSKTGRCCYDARKEEGQPARWTSIECGVTEARCRAMAEAGVHGKDTTYQFKRGGQCGAATGPLDCSNPNDSPPSRRPPGRTKFEPYDCRTSDDKEIVDWEGKGCHPLEHGYPSACRCETDADCVGDETCNNDGICVSPDGYSCVCASDGGASCANGRSCRDGACMKSCSSDADCPPRLACKDSLCEAGGTTTVEQTYANLKGGDSPLHSVTTYALMNFFFELFTKFHLDIGGHINLGFFSADITLLHLAEKLPLVTVNETVFERGLEARYEHACASNPDAVVEDHQSSQTRSLPTSGGSASTEEFVDACMDELPDKVTDPTPPEAGDLVTSVEETYKWAKDFTLEIQKKMKVCIDGEPMRKWVREKLSNRSDLLERKCVHEDRLAGERHEFQCKFAIRNLGRIWDASTLNPAAKGAEKEMECMANHFPEVVERAAGLDEFSHISSARDWANIVDDQTGHLKVSKLSADPDKPLGFERVARGPYGSPLLDCTNPPGPNATGLRKKVRQMCKSKFGHWTKCDAFDSAKARQACRNHTCEVFDAQIGRLNITASSQKSLFMIFVEEFMEALDRERVCECRTDADCSDVRENESDDSVRATCEAAKCVLSTGEVQDDCPVLELADTPEMGPCCGDGIVQDHEECDDGNRRSGDGCSSTCRDENEPGGGGDEPTGVCCSPERPLADYPETDFCFPDVRESRCDGGFHADASCGGGVCECETIRRRLDTGVDAKNSALPPGRLDRDWWWAAQRNQQSGFGPVARTVSVRPPPAWGGSLGASGWISIGADPSSGHGPRPLPSGAADNVYLYRTAVELPDDWALVSDPRLELQIHADDRIKEVRLNGRPVWTGGGQTNPGNYAGSPVQVAVTQSGRFEPGENVVEVVVQNKMPLTGHSRADVTGLDVSGDLAATYGTGCR